MEFRLEVKGRRLRGMSYDDDVVEWKLWHTRGVLDWRSNPLLHEKHPVWA
jgi:hypothetical protein